MMSSTLLIPLMAMRGYRLPEPWILLRGVGVQAAILVLVAALLLLLPSGVTRIRMLVLSLCALWISPLLQQPLVRVGMPEWALAAGIGWLILVLVFVPVRVMDRLNGWAATAEQFGVAAFLVAIVVAAALYGQERMAGLPRESLELMTRPVMLRAQAGRPDIYHIVLDGLGRPDVLRARYDLDLGPELDRLRRLGFSVDDDTGLTNYTQTYQVLASMLNLRYLDDLPDDLRSAYSRQPMRDLIDHAALIESLKAIGYGLDVIGSTDQLRWHREADRCECSYPWLGLFESQVLLRSPLGNVPWHRLQHSLYRSHLLETLASLEAYKPQGRPRLLLAHLMLPHVPFVLGAGGHHLTPDRTFSFAEGRFWEGTSEEYRDGYAAQTKFTVARAIAIAERLIETAQDAGRRAIVILHGDHGPRGPAQGSIGPFDADEVFPVFLAIRVPQSDSQLETRSVGSLVNLYRVILSSYFGADLPVLPDVSYMSSFERPYDFTRVASTRDHARD